MTSSLTSPVDTPAFDQLYVQGPINNSLVHSLYPPDGIDYQIPSSDYRLRYFKAPRELVPSTMTLGALQAASEHGSNIYSYLKNQFGADHLIEFEKSGARGGHVEYEGVSVAIKKPAFTSPTYSDAYWIMKGVGSAAEEKGCLESARIVVFKTIEKAGGTRGNVVVAFANLGAYKEPNADTLTT